MTEIHTVLIDELPGVGRLGRHVEHDERSLSFLVDDQVPIVSVAWARHTPILDQGATGSCTGNAAAGALGCDPFCATLPAGNALDEAEAVELYHEATMLDSIPGVYPPDDTGSTGLAVAKATQRAGLISGYQHATSITAALAALQAGPVIVGVSWYDSFDTPAPNGLVEITPGAQVRGGHEFVIRALDVDAQLLQADNSWGTSWGVNGSFTFSVATLEQLLAEQGDCTSFVPLTQPAPTPTPVPTKSADEVLHERFQRMVAAEAAWWATKA